MSKDATGFGLADGFALAGGDLAELWWRYVAVGGRSVKDELDRRVREQVPVDHREHNLIAQALNELFLDRQIGTFPVAYVSPPAQAPHRTTAQTVSYSREARRWAGQARQRSVEANRRAVELHLAAALLMQTSGQLHFARSARRRAGQALARHHPA